MAENWKCHQCTALNHYKRNQCWQCGSDRSGEKEIAPSRPISGGSIKFRRNLILMIAGVMVVIGLFVIPSGVDRRNYHQGVKAVENDECASAIDEFDKVISGWRLIDFDGYVPSAQEKKEECLAFLTGVDEHRVGDYSAAFLAYRDFVRSYPDSPFVHSAYELAQMMFAQGQPDILASQKTCGEIHSFTDIGLLPEPDINLPLFYLACGALYDSIGEQVRSFEMYTTFLIEYPQHPMAPEAIASITMNPAACQDQMATPISPCRPGVPPH